MGGNGCLLHQLLLLDPDRSLPQKDSPRWAHYNRITEMKTLMEKQGNNHRDPRAQTPGVLSCVAGPL